MQGAAPNSSSERDHSRCGHGDSKPVTPPICGPRRQQPRSTRRHHRQHRDRRRRLGNDNGERRAVPDLHRPPRPRVPQHQQPCRGVPPRRVRSHRRRHRPLMPALARSGRGVHVRCRRLPRRTVHPQGSRRRGHLDDQPRRCSARHRARVHHRRCMDPRRHRLGRRRRTRRARRTRPALPRTRRWTQPARQSARARVIAAIVPVAVGVSLGDRPTHSRSPDSLSPRSPSGSSPAATSA